MNFHPTAIKSQKHMTLKITIDLDNTAFAENPGTETARILRELAADIDGNPFSVRGIVKRLRDINGNAVGKATIE